MMASEEPTRNTTQRTSQDITGEQAPVGNATTATSEPAVPTEQAEGNKLRSPGGNDDEAFNTKAKETEQHVTGTFEKAFDYLRRPVAGKTGETGSDSAQGKGSRVFKNRWDDDDTIENQMKNTKAQVVGTFRGICSAFQNIRGGAKKTDSSEK